MDFWEILYTIADNEGIPTTHIGPKLGLSREYVPTGKCKKKDIQISTASKLLGACNYMLVAVPKTLQLPDGVIVIDTAKDKQEIINNEG